MILIGVATDGLYIIINKQNFVCFTAGMYVVLQETLDAAVAAYQKRAARRSNNEQETVQPPDPGGGGGGKYTTFLLADNSLRALGADPTKHSGAISAIIVLAR